MRSDLFRGLSRRHFLRASASATLAALAAGEPRLLAEEKPKLTPKADSMILLWMAGGMAQTETFDPKRYTRIQRGSTLESSTQHISEHPDCHRWRAAFTGPREYSQDTRPRNSDPFAPCWRSRLHLALTSSIPLAHRVCPTPIRSRAAHGSDDLADARPTKSRHTGIHRYRSES